MRRIYIPGMFAACAALALTACTATSASEPTPTTTATATPIAPTIRYDSPTQMRDKVAASGVKLRECGRPAYNVWNALFLVCFTGTGPAEQVSFYTGVTAQNGPPLKQAVEGFGRPIYIADSGGWAVDANSAETVARVGTILNAAPTSR